MFDVLQTFHPSICAGIIDGSLCVCVIIWSYSCGSSGRLLPKPRLVRSLGAPRRTDGWHPANLTPRLKRHQKWPAYVDPAWRCAGWRHWSEGRWLWVDLLGGTTASHKNWLFWNFEGQPLKSGGLSLSSFVHHFLIMIVSFGDIPGKTVFSDTSSWLPFVMSMLDSNPRMPWMWNFIAFFASKMASKILKDE